MVVVTRNVISATRFISLRATITRLKSEQFFNRFIVRIHIPYKIIIRFYTSGELCISANSILWKVINIYRSILKTELATNNRKTTFKNCAGHFLLFTIFSQ